MSDPVLHIKDSFFFEVPKILAPSDFKKRADFPDVWISLDPEFQEWEFKRLFESLHELGADLPPEEAAHHDWHEWVHGDHANFAKPFDEFLEHKYREQLAEFHVWRAALVAGAKDDAQLARARNRTFDDFLKTARGSGTDQYLNWSQWRDDHAHRSQWAAARHEAGNVDAYRKDTSVAEWSAEKIQAYNHHLSGKVIIPQPFGRLRNLHEAETSLIDQNTAWINWNDPGLCISKFMLIELAVGLIVCLLFAWLARKLSAGGPPRGMLWNVLEVFYLFIRDKIARPALGGHEEGHGDEHGEPDAHGHGHAEHAHAAHAHDDPAAKVTPLLMTFFFFILGCNLMGMLPWAGSPTASFAVTVAMAMTTFATVVVLGMGQFGFFGFFLNQIPGMSLPWYMSILIKPMLLAIELLGLLIKHGVLAVRLLANMVAGHLVILGVMGIAFGAEAALALSAPENSWQWWVAAPIAVVAATAFNLLELLVAFLQAYVFTFLSALFIGAALHKH